MNPDRSPAEDRAVRAVGATFSRLQDVVYAILGILLFVSALALLARGAVDFARALPQGVNARAIVSLLDVILLALMVIELLYTVQVSFRAHALVAEPFLLVALIASVRRILVITAEFGAQAEHTDEHFRHVMVELALLTVLVLVLVASVVILRRHEPTTDAPPH